MMRITTAIFVVFASGAAHAQTWCTPGAEWIFNFGSQQASGVRHAWYSGDTLIAGLQCQRIDQTVYAYQPVPPIGTPFTFQDGPLFTHGQNDLVRIWDQVDNVFDTLAWFGAVPGDRWNVPQYAFSGACYFDVLDTGTRVIEGIPLRYLVVEEPIVMGFVDTLIERIGFLRYYLRPMETIVIDHTTHGLVCYRDADIAQYDGWFQQHPCDFTLSLTDLVDAPFGTLFPNPGSDHFTLDLPPGSHTVTLIDATGRMVLQQRTTDARPVIDVKALPAGLYRMSVRNEQGRVMGAAWAKE